MTLQIRTLRIYPATIAVISLFGSVFSPVVSAVEAPYEQDFLVTAYYSPLPDQCCYVRGSYEEDIAFNGQGIRGASGKEVHPGMIAAPAEYSFGMRIALPGIGVGTVEDRGGRIIQWENGLHRVDIWMGTGEEGLKRAMNFGAQIVRGTVYPLGSSMPQESIALTNFAAPQSALAATTRIQKSLLTSESRVGDHSSSVRLLQEALRETGYFSHAVTGLYGDVTKASLAAFQQDFGIEGDGSVADDQTRAVLLARKAIGEHAPDISILSPGDQGQAVSTAQRLLRSLHAYKGRTNGIYDESMKAQIVTFQMQRSVISNPDEAGAGRIGPATREAIVTAWRGMRIQAIAKTAMRKIEVARLVEDLVPASTLARGDNGADVRLLQTQLAHLGYFSHAAINGNFGVKTEAALKQYQQDKEIVSSTKEKGAGVFGPMTQQQLRTDALGVAWKLVRAQGSSAL